MAESSRRWIHGLHAVTAALERHPERVLEIVLAANREDQRIAAIRKRAEGLGLAVQRASNEAIAKIAGDVVHQGALASVRSPPALEERSFLASLDALSEDALLLVLDGVTDPHNLGACLRSADGAGVHGLVIPRDRAAGIDGTVRKVAAGAAEFVPVVSVVNLARTLDLLKERGIWVVGLAEDGAKSLFDSDLKRPLALVLGAEGSGLRRLTKERCDYLVRIPMRGSVGSLNVSVAAAIALFEARRQRI